MRVGSGGRRAAGRRARILVAGIVAAAVAAACGAEPRVALDTLVLQDSVYLEPGTRAPYTGEVFRRFPDEGRMQLEGRLEEGLWHGELTVWHPGGSIRYQGRLADGVQCGAWVENREEGSEESVYQELRREIESMGVYPPCPDR